MAQAVWMNQLIRDGVVAKPHRNDMMNMVPTVATTCLPVQGEKILTRVVGV